MKSLNDEFKQALDSALLAHSVGTQKQMRETREAVEALYRAAQEDAARLLAVLEYAVKCDEPQPFLNNWLHGDWEQCRYWDAPEACYPPDAARGAKS